MDEVRTGISSEIPAKDFVRYLRPRRARRARDAGTSTIRLRPRAIAASLDWSSSDRAGTALPESPGDPVRPTARQIPLPEWT